MSAHCPGAAAAFGTDEHIKVSRNHSILCQTSPAQTPTHPFKAETVRAVLFSKPVQQIPSGLKSSADERIKEDRIESFVKFKLHYVSFIPLIFRACHSVLKKEIGWCWQDCSLQSNADYYLVFCDRMGVCKSIFWWFVLVFSTYEY